MVERSQRRILGGNPQSLYLPVIIDPEYHYETVNVEAQRSNPSSLWWTRRIVALRRRHQVFGRGTSSSSTRRTREFSPFSALRRGNSGRGGQPLTVQPVRRTGPDRLGGSVPVELFGRTEFPRIGEGPWVLTLGPHSFYWFELVPSFEPITATGEAVPELTIRGPLESLFEERTGFPLALLRYARKRAWFRSRLRRRSGRRIPRSSRWATTGRILAGDAGGGLLGGRAGAIRHTARRGPGRAQSTARPAGHRPSQTG